jgi:competence protein ComEC
MAVPAQPADMPAAAAPVDLRLALGALAAWLAAAAVLGATAPTGYLAGGVAVLAAGGALALRRGWAPVAALVLGCAGVTALATAARVQARDASPVTRLAAERAAVTVDLVLRTDPRPVRSGPATRGDRVSMLARVRRVGTGGREWMVSTDVVVLAPASGWSGLLPSQPVSAKGRLGPRLRAGLTSGVLSVAGTPERVAPPSPVHRVAGRLRAGLQDAAAVLPEGPRGLLPGLVLGDTSRLDPALAGDFQTTGLTHLTAVSGTNCVIITGAVLLLLRRLTIGPRVSALGAGLSLAGFVVLARPSPSVLRAAVMSGIALVALAAGRPRAALPALATAVLALVLAAPGLAREPGFALSVAATASLLLIAPGWAARLRRRGVPVGIAEAVSVAAAAHLATAPLVAALSGQVSLVAIAANLLAVPAVAPATVLGVLAAAIAPLSEASARLLVRLAGVPVGWLVAVAERGATVPAAAMAWPEGAAGAGALAVVLWVVVVLARHRGARRVAVAAVAGAAVVAAPARLMAPGWPPPHWLLVVCDVGQGDQVAVRAGPAAAVVIDTGPDPVAADSCLRRLGITRVPLLVLTHLHADHVRGLDGVLRRREVAELEVGPLHQPAWAWRLVEEAAHRRGFPVRQAAVGEIRAVAGVRMEVIAPAAAFRGTRSDPNNSSVVLRVHASGLTLLLTGDVEVEAQDTITRSGVGLRAEVLKVPHHGSAWQSPAFLAAVHPALAIVSVGAGNDYGHPSPLLLAELSRLGARTLRTDQDGDIAVSADGPGLTVTTRSRGPPVRGRAAPAGAIRRMTRRAAHHGTGCSRGGPRGPVPHRPVPRCPVPTVTGTDPLARRRSVRIRRAARRAPGDGRHQARAPERHAADQPRARPADSLLPRRWSPASGARSVQCPSAMVRCQAASLSRSARGGLADRWHGAASVVVGRACPRRLRLVPGWLRGR